MRRKDKAKAVNCRSSYKEVGDVGVVRQDQGAEQKGFRSLFRSQGLKRQSEGRGYFSK